MLLPARGLHDGGDRHPLRSSQEAEDLLLLRAGSGLRLKLFLSGSFSGQPFAAARGFWFRAAGLLGHLGLLLRLRRRRAPSPPKPRSSFTARGAESPKRLKALHKTQTVTLCVHRKSSPCGSVFGRSARQLASQRIATPRQVPAPAFAASRCAAGPGWRYRVRSIRVLKTTVGSAFIARTSHRNSTISIRRSPPSYFATKD